MSIIKDAFINALLADATYALKIDGYKSSSNASDRTDLIERLSVRMTPKLAEYIGNNFTVITHVDSDDQLGSGFDATVWKRNDGKIFVTMTGTEDIGDFITDADLTLGNGAPARQIVDMVNWWMRISTPAGVSAKQIAMVNLATIPLVPVAVGNLFPSYFYATTPVTGEGLITAGIPVTVDGHSLGGALASTFANLFNGSSVAVNDVETFNSAGYGWWAPLLFAQIKALLPAGNNFVGYTQKNYFADNGLSATTRTFANTQFGNRIPLSQEESAVAIYENHYMYKITDMLALGDAMSSLDAGLDIVTLNKIVKAGSNDGSASYESVLDALRKIVGLYKSSLDATPIGDIDKSAASRKKYYENLFELQDNANFKSLSGKVLITDKFIGNNPQQDYSQFLALYYLTPFVLEAPESLLKTFNSDLYNSWRSDTLLNAEDRNNGKANYSDSWYADRSAMLNALLARNTVDAQHDRASKNSNVDYWFIENSSNTNFFSTSPSGGVHRSLDVFFGDDTGNTLTGNYADVRFYGGAGNDTLKGMAGFDYLEGDNGNDLLYGGDGADQLYGGAGNDQLVGEGGCDLLFGGDGNDTYSFTGQFGRDIIKDSDNQGSIEFSSIKVSSLTQSSKDSIVYYDNVTNPTKKAVVIDEGNTKSLIISTVTKTGNKIIDSGNSVTVKNWVDGSLGLTLAPASTSATPQNLITINGNGGDNALSIYNKREDEVNFSWNGTDPLSYSGGAGRDLILGTREGNETLTGGDGNDIIMGGNTGSTEYGKDVIDGGDGDDYIYSAPLNSTAHGGKGNDFLRADSIANIHVQAVSANVTSNPNYNSHPALTRDQVWQDLLSVMNYDFYFFGFKSLKNNLSEYASVSGSKFLLEPKDFQQIGSDNWITGSNLIYTASIAGFSYDYDKSYIGKTTTGSMNLSTPLSYSIGGIGLFGTHTYDDVGAILFGDEGDDAIAGGIYSDQLLGGSGSDHMWGGKGNDLMDGGTENDTLNGNDGIDTLIGGFGDDELWGGGVDISDVSGNVLYGGSGNDKLVGSQGDDYLDGGTGADELNGGDGDNYLFGGDDTDKDNLVAGSGDDILVMGKSDTGNAGGGNNIYIWDTHQVTTTNTPPSTPAALKNSLSINNASPSFTMADVGGGSAPSLTQPDVIWIYNTQGSNTLGIIGQSGFNGIRTIFSNNILQMTTTNGQQIQVADLQSNNALKIVFGNSIEQLSQTPPPAFTLTDDHFLNGIAPLDQADVTTADMTLALDEVSTQFTSSQANIYLAGSLVNDELTASVGGSKMIGGKGNDKLIGDIGDDTYLIRKGDGNDVITEKGGKNHIKLDKNIQVSDVHAYRLGADLVLKISQQQSVTVKNMFDATTGALISANSIQDITFYDNTLWNINAIKANAMVSTVADDTISGFETNDTLRGDKGNDLILGGAGNDLFQYATGDGEDTISDNSGVDTLELSGITRAQVTTRRDANNNLILSFASGGKITILDAFDSSGNFTNNIIENIKFTSENATWASADIKTEVLKNLGRNIIGTSASEVINGDAGKDILNSGVGNDQLFGGAGDDTYQYALGDGNDTIVDTAGVDMIQFGTGITSSNMYLKADPNGKDLLVKMDSGETLTVKDMFVEKGAALTPQIASVIDSLKNRWISQAEKLIEDNFGLTSNIDLKLNFVRLGAGGTQAYISIGMMPGASKANELILNIDLDDFTDFPNGNGAIYYDRVIAHELVHAITAANTNSTVLPSWFTEGTAEFLHGGDSRVANNLGYFPDQTSFNSYFKTTPGEQPTAGYAVSYIAVKLLDQDIRNHGGTGIKDVFDQLKAGHSLDESLSIVSLAIGMSDVWTNLASFENRVRTIGFTNMTSIVNLGDADTGSVDGSDYGNQSLDANDILPDVNTGAPKNFNLVIPAQYQTAEDNRIDVIKFANGDTWDLARIKLEIEKGKLRGTAGNDVIVGTTGNDILSGDKGQDQLIGDSGDDVYIYKSGDGNDIINDFDGNDTLILRDIDETQVTVKSDSGYLIFSISDGSTIRLTNALDSYGEFTSHNIETISFANNKTWDLARIKKELLTIRGTDNNDLLIGTDGDDTIYGGLGWDRLYGKLGNDFLNGGEGNDEIDTGGGNDIVNGDAGNDYFTSTSGNVIFDGGSGEDTFWCLNGNDTIINEDGKDSIYFNSLPIDIKIENVNDLAFYLSNGTKITVKDCIDTNGNIVVSKYFAHTKNSQNGYWNDWDVKAINQSIVRVTGTDGNDILNGSSVTDTMTGGKGNDTLIGNGGDDVYFYNKGDGKDSISDISGKNEIRFGTGIGESDVIVRFDRYNNNFDIFLGNDGHISGPSLDGIRFSNNTYWDKSRLIVEGLKPSTISEVLAGSDANDILQARGGEDTLVGAAGDDIYIVNKGDSDFITIDDSAGSNDVIKFGNGITLADITVQQSQNYNGLTIGLASGEALYIINGATPNQSIESIQFSNGDILTQAQLISMASSYSKTETNKVVGTASNDILRGVSWNDSLDGGAGNDILYGGTGSDTLLGGLGDDSLYGSDGFDKLDGGDGNDLLIGGAGSDTLIGGIGNDTLISSTKDDYWDTLQGGAGDDTYILNSGLISDTGGNDTLILPDNISPDNIRVSFSPGSGGQNSIVTIDTLPDSVNTYGKGIVSIDAWDWINNDFIMSHWIESIKFANGTLWSINELRTFILNGTAANDFQAGTTGNDVFKSSAGNDTLVGKAGDDTYTYKKGDGNDEIYDTAGNDILQLMDLYESDVVQVRENLSSPYQYALEIKFSTGQIIINDQFRTKDDLGNPLSTFPGVESIRFADGATWDINRMKAEAIKGTNSDDYIFGFAINEKIDGGLGNDTIFGYGGKDTLIGGIGNDVLIAESGSTFEGGVGNDTIMSQIYTNNFGSTIKYSRGDGKDTISGSGLNDVIELGQGINNTDVTLTRMGYDLLMDFGQGDQILAQWVFSDTSNKILLSSLPGTLKFSNGTTKNLSQYLTNLGYSLTPPAIYSAQVNAAGTVIFGVANPSNTIEVNGNFQTKADSQTGNFSITLPTALINKETINLIAYDEVANRSAVLILVAPDLTAPALPTATLDVAGKIVSGVAEAGSTVEVKNGTTLLGSIISDVTTGVYSITLTNALLNKETINVTAKDAAGNISKPKTIIATDKTPPAQPTAAFDANGKVVSGVAEAGSTVEVKNSTNTTSLGTVVANASTGAYSITLVTALINKETVNVTAKDAAGNISTPKPIIAPDKTAPTQPTAAFDTTGKIITGVAEAGSTVEVRNSGNTTLLGSVVADVTTGAYSITLVTALINKETVNVTAKDIAGNTSPLKAIIAPDKTAPTQPTAAFDTAGKVITGVAEAGSTVEVKNSTNTTSLGSVVANATTGAYSITLTTALINKETVNVTAKDVAGNISVLKAIIAPDKTAPSQPSAAFDATGKTITGVAETGSTVEVKNSANTTSLGTVVANATTGAYSITLATALINTETVNVTAKDVAGNISILKAIIAPDKTAPSQPTAAFDTTGKIITGIAEAGSTVEVKNSGNTTTLGTATANASTGAYTITLTTALINKETVNVTAKDIAGNISVLKAIIAPDKTAPTQPTAAFDTAGKVITGVSEAGSTVEVKNSTNTTSLGTVVANATTGAYSITLATALINKETVNVTAKDIAGNTSISLVVNAPDKTAPAQPTAAFDPAGKVITGVAEAGSTVEVKNSTNTTSLGTVVANATTGAYSITLATALINKETVNITAKDVAGNISIAKAFIAPDKTAPIQPTATFDATGKIVSGVAEVGSTVEVKNSANTTSLGTVVANATTGAYSITLTTALINKEIVNVTAKDIAGNTSIPLVVNAPDKTAPAQPTAAFDAAGKVINGVAEAGSTVEVKNSTNTTSLGTVVANATTGGYSITLATALINNETVNVTAKDVAGNISVLKAIIAPDKTAPAQPTAAFDTAGKVITGVAEAGSTVEVKNSTNTTSLGNVVANATTGAYSITLATALTKKETVNVTAKDVAGNVSPVKAIVAPQINSPLKAVFVESSPFALQKSGNVNNQLDSMIQAMAAFAPPSAAESKVLVGVYDSTQPILVSHS